MGWSFVPLSRRALIFPEQQFETYSAACKFCREYCVGTMMGTSKASRTARERLKNQYSGHQFAGNDV